MNNIEILEGFINRDKQMQEDYKVRATIQGKEIDAIENLIQENKELIQENKKLKKQMGKDLDVIYIKGVYDERDKWKNKIRELLEHYKNTGYDELEEVLQELLEKGE